MFIALIYVRDMDPDLSTVRCDALARSKQLNYTCFAFRNEMS